MKCWDCHKVVWPWQLKGVDGESHRRCHRLRVQRLMFRLPQCAKEILKEHLQIEKQYKGDSFF